MPENPKIEVRVDDPYKDYNVVSLQETPLVIDWKGKIGYGDIISPICYAFNMAEKNNTDVVLNFHWDAEGPTKYKESDSETIIDWIDYIYNNTVKPIFWDVKINHIWNSKLPYNHSNYDDAKMSLHNLRFSNIGMQDYNNEHSRYKELVFVTTTKHAQTLEEYDKNKTWKDPLGATPGGHAWPRVADICAKRGWKIHHVHYETPINTCVKKLIGARAVIGYHGAHMWLAKWLGKPMIVFSKKEITNRAFPWALRYEYWTDFSPDTIEEQIQLSVNKREQTLNELRYYLTNSNIHRLRSQRT